MDSYRIRRLKRGLAAYREGYIEDMLELIHPDCVVEAEQRVGRASRWHGPSGVAMMISEWEETSGSGELYPQRFTELGTCVVVPISHVRGGLVDRADLENEHCHVYRFRGPMVVEWRIYREVSAAFEFARRSGIMIAAARRVPVPVG